ncbi:helix-turn-helix transcriptional regulator [Micromonospora mirobrigensis]|uniref:Helix-turn-helix domain-containing protein n=1 Tax=Micromonospora mirobrigensis TaxID=262898 RepID=A0A1C4YQ13_9ACTN|nr:helix-turn-helix domain-containing protein [Micromonospora mirobrigensis]SCF22750.1 Helix-turn-helix domain-containing protein [Micromonospora mirobrigensis]
MATSGTAAVRRALATPPEIATFLGVPEKTLTQWRYVKTGPRWSKVGRHVRYRWEDVEKWLDQQAGAAA